MLRGYFRHQRRQVYVGAELPVYYPGERRVGLRRRTDEEMRRREEAERRLAELHAELERLRPGRG